MLSSRMAENGTYPGGPNRKPRRTPQQMAAFRAATRGERAVRAIQAACAALDTDGDWYVAYTADVAAEWAQDAWHDAQVAVPEP